MYTSLEMLFADYVMKDKKDGGCDIEDVPALLRPNVQRIVDESYSGEKKQESK